MDEWHTVFEQELFSEPKESHLPLENAEKLHTPGAFFSREISREESGRVHDREAKEQVRIITTISRQYRYHFNLLDPVEDRLYDQYKWHCYRRAQKPCFSEKGYLKALKDQTIHRQLYNERHNIEVEYPIEMFRKETKRQAKIPLFQKRMKETLWNTIKAAWMCRTVEFHMDWRDSGRPELSKLEDQERNDLELHKRCFYEFYEAGMASGIQRNIHGNRSLLISIERGKLIFFYGKSVYYFSVKEDGCFYQGKKADFITFFKNLEEERRCVRKLYLDFMIGCRKQGLVYEYMDDPNAFFCYREVDSNDVFMFRYKNAVIRLPYRNGSLYRKTGEKVIEPTIIARELIEKGDLRKKAELKAKQFFRLFLSEKERKVWNRIGAIKLETEGNIYVISTEMRFNPIIRISKTSEKKEALCIMVDNPYIPRHDVLLSSMMLIKSGNEERLNQNANPFPLNTYHKKLLEKIKKAESRLGISV